MRHNLPRAGAVVSVCLLLLVGLVAAQAQNADKGDGKAANGSKSTTMDVDFQVYLLVGAESPTEGGKIPAVLEPVAKQLKAALPYTSYRVRDTMLQRVRGRNGRLESRWANGESAAPPTFFELTAVPISLITDEDGRESVSVENFRFGVRIPIVTGNTAHASNSAAPAPVVNYEPVGLTTGFQVALGEPAVIGTVSTGKDGEIGVVVVLVRKSPGR